MMRRDAAVVPIVEDDPDALFLLQRALLRAGLSFPVRVAVDGSQALEYLSGEGPFADRASHPLPCVVLLHLKLRKKSGLEVLQWMRTQLRLRRIPVIIISTPGEEQDQRRALELGARDDHLKPIDTADLYRLGRGVQTYLRLFYRQISRAIEEDPLDPGTPLKDAPRGQEARGA